MNEIHPIDRAAKLLNLSLEGLGALLGGITKGAVSQWKAPDRVVPSEYCPVIERLTKGKVRCEELNPDVDWTYLRPPELAKLAKLSKKKV